MTITEIFERLAGPIQKEKQTVSPLKSARRHGCEVCHKVFVCHLCTLGNIHPAHRNAEERETVHLYVCRKCCKEPDERYRYIWRHSGDGAFMYRWCLRTGIRLERRLRKHGE